MDHLANVKKWVVQGVEGIPPLDGRLKWQSIFVEKPITPTPTSLELLFAVASMHDYAMEDIANVMKLDIQAYTKQLVQMQIILTVFKTYRQQDSFYSKTYRQDDYDRAQKINPSPYAFTNIQAFINAISKYESDQYLNRSSLWFIRKWWFRLVSHWDPTWTSSWSMEIKDQRSSNTYHQLPRIINSASFLFNKRTSTPQSILLFDIPRLVMQFQHNPIKNTTNITPSPLSTNEPSSSSNTFITSHPQQYGNTLPLESLFITQPMLLKRMDVPAETNNYRLTLLGSMNEIIKNYVSFKVTPVCDVGLLVIIELYRTMIQLSEQVSELAYQLIYEHGASLSTPVTTSSTRLNTNQSQMNTNQFQINKNQSQLNDTMTLMMDRFDMMGMIIATVNVYIELGMSQHFMHDQSKSEYTSEGLNGYIQRMLTQVIPQHERNSLSNHVRTQQDDSRRASSSPSARTSSIPTTTTTTRQPLMRATTHTTTNNNNNNSSFNILDNNNPLLPIDTFASQFKQELRGGATPSTHTQAESKHTSIQQTEAIEIVPAFLRQFILSDPLPMMQLETDSSMMTWRGLSIGHVWSIVCLTWSWSIWRMRSLVAMLNIDLAINEANRWFVEYLLSAQAAYFAFKEPISLFDFMHTLAYRQQQEARRRTTSSRLDRSSKTILNTSLTPNDDSMDDNIDDNDLSESLSWMDELFSPMVLVNAVEGAKNPLLMRVFDSRQIDDELISLYHLQPLIPFVTLKKQVIHNLTNKPSFFNLIHHPQPLTMSTNSLQSPQLQPLENLIRTDPLALPHTALREDKYEKLLKHVPIHMQHFVSLCEPVNINMVDFLIHSPNWNTFLDVQQDPWMMDKMMNTSTLQRFHPIEISLVPMVTVFNAMMVQIYLGLRLAYEQFGLILPSLNTSTLKDDSYRTGRLEHQFTLSNASALPLILSQWMNLFLLRTSPIPSTPTLQSLRLQRQNGRSNSSNKTSQANTFDQDRQQLLAMMMNQSLDFSSSTHRHVLNFYQLLDFSMPPSTPFTQDRNRNTQPMSMHHFHIPVFGIRVKLAEFSNASARTVLRESKSVCEQMNDPSEINSRNTSMLINAMDDLFDYATLLSTNLSTPLASTTSRSTRPSGTSSIQWEAPSQSLLDITHDMNDFIWACKCCLLENQSIPKRVRQMLINYWSELNQQAKDGIVDMTYLFYQTSPVSRSM